MGQLYDLRLGRVHKQTESAGLTFDPVKCAVQKILVRVNEIKVVHVAGISLYPQHRLAVVVNRSRVKDPRNLRERCTDSEATPEHSQTFALAGRRHFERVKYPVGQVRRGYVRDVTFMLFQDSGQQGGQPDVR